VTAPSPDPRVDELRQRLRALGYLDAGVDRFVLGPATGTRRPAAIALLASLRTGIIAALLLGPAAAIGVAARLPGLVRGPRDAAVIAIYMGVLFGAGVSAAAFAASLAVASLAGERVARRARTAAAAAGALVAIACLVYLTLWWRTANLGLASSIRWTIFALAVAAAISLLLGHAARLTALAVIMAGRSDEAPAVRQSSSWRMSIAIGLVAFAGASVLLVATAPASGNDRTTPELTVVPSGAVVRVIGIDGVDPGVFAELAAAGRLPHLAAALSGARATLASENTRDPARLWTTIATGQPPDVHGVHGLETRRVAGVEGVVASGEPSPIAGALRATTDLLRLTRPAIASGSERREKTLWEVAADAGLRTEVVNWWATWPAPADRPRDTPIILSDRTIPRLERGGELDAEIAPRSMYERLRPAWPELRRQAEDLAGRLLGEAGAGDSAIRAVLTRSAVLDVLQVELPKSVEADAEPDVIAVYFPGLDIAQQALLGGPGQSRAPAAVAIRLEALRGYYVFLDRLLERLLTPRRDLVAVVVTEPGRLNASATGMLALTGGPARPGARAEARAVDVMPTVLHALGVPISRGLAGRVLTDLFTPEFLSRHPVRQVDAYGSPSTSGTVRSGKPLDQEMIDRLRSLGYIK
jgi:type I phosphodiesterase/nucleotide pyrophosphatase